LPEWKLSKITFDLPFQALYAELDYKHLPSKIREAFFLMWLIFKIRFIKINVSYLNIPKIWQGLALFLYLHFACSPYSAASYKHFDFRLGAWTLTG